MVVGNKLASFSAELARLVCDKFAQEESKKLARILSSAINKLGLSVIKLARVVTVKLVRAISSKLAGVTAANLLGLLAVSLLGINAKNLLGLPQVNLPRQQLLLLFLPSTKTILIVTISKKSDSYPRLCCLLSCQGCHA